MYCVICDDSSKDRETLSGFLSRYFASRGVDFDYEEYASGESLLEAAQLSPRRADMLFLDVYMKNLNGVDAARELRRRGWDGSLVFTTASRDFAADGFDLDADDYLVKPYDYGRFERAMGRSADKWDKQRKTVEFISRYSRVSVYLSEILYIESVPHGCAVHTARQALPTRSSLHKFEEMLKDSDTAFRLRKSHIINLSGVGHFDDEYIYMKNGDRLAIPVRDKTRVKQRLLKYYWART